MKWWYWLLVSTIVVLCVVLVVQFGMGPRPVRIMNPTVFENAQQIGAVTYRRLFADLNKVDAVILGIQTRFLNHQEIPKGFVKTAASQKLTFDSVIIDKELSYSLPWPKVQVMDLKENVTELLTTLEKAKEQSKKVLIITHSYYSSSIPYKSLSHFLREKTQLNFTSFSSVPLALSVTQEKDLQPRCQTTGEGAAGVGRIGCFILRKSRTVYRKKLIHKGLVAAIDQVALRDYLIYVSL